MKVLIINGPNLSRLDIRDSSIYGDLNYAELVEFITDAAARNGFEADIRQSNDEATIIGWLHEAADLNLPVVINPQPSPITAMQLEMQLRWSKAPSSKCTCLIRYLARSSATHL